MSLVGRKALFVAVAVSAAIATGESFAQVVYYPAYRPVVAAPVVAATLATNVRTSFAPALIDAEKPLQTRSWAPTVGVPAALAGEPLIVIDEVDAYVNPVGRRSVIA